MLLKCPVCNSDTSKKFLKYGHWIRECTFCQHRFTEYVPTEDHIERIYGDDYFFDMRFITRFFGGDKNNESVLRQAQYPSSYAVF